MCKTTAQDELLKKIEAALTAHSSPADLAHHMGINPGIVYHVLDGGWSPKLARKMGVRVTEVDRMAARLTPEEGRRAREWLRRRGYDSPTEFWREVIE